jgi:hypothetical protein
VFLLRVEFRRRLQLGDYSVDAGAHETLAAQLFDHVRMLALARVDQRREQQDRRSIRQPQHLVDHLADGLRQQVVAMVRAARDADARE